MVLPLIDAITIYPKRVRYLKNFIFKWKRTTVVLLLSIHQSQELSNAFLENNWFHLGTKTPYRLVANTEDNVISYPGCVPKKMIGIIRHGTRTPGHKNVKKIKDFLLPLTEYFKRNDNIFKTSEIHDEDKLLIRNWTLFMENDGEKFLTKEGEREMFLLGNRIKKRFPSLFPSYNNDTFLFKFTKTQRTEESAKFFSLGLLGNNKNIWFPEPEDPDPILRFYKLCKKWRKEVKKSPASTKERKEFINSTEVQKMLLSLSKRLGLNFCLSFETVQVMYSTCCFETAWFPGKRSPWCSIFKELDIKVLEYAEELKYYWRDGYGFDINYKQSCPLFNNILDFLSGASEDKRSSVFYFTHSGTLLKSISRLGLYQDPFIITSALESHKKETRLWRVSYIDTFGTNLFFTLFSCEDGSEKVLVSHQERQVQVGSCPLPPQLCPLSEIRKLLTLKEGCDFQQICSLHHES